MSAPSTLADRLYAHAAHAAGLSEEHLRSRGRGSGAEVPRYAVWLVLWENGWAMERIGRETHHERSTVSTALKRARTIERGDRRFEALVAELRRIARAEVLYGSIDASVTAALTSIEADIASARALRARIREVEDELQVERVKLEELAKKSPAADAVSSRRRRALEAAVADSAVLAGIVREAV